MYYYHYPLYYNLANTYFGYFLDHTHIKCYTTLVGVAVGYGDQLVGLPTGHCQTIEVSAIREDNK